MERKQPVKKSHSNLGEYLKTGGPGRPKGSKNKYTAFKEDIIDIWHEEDGKEKLRELFHKSREFRQLVKDLFIPLLPKEPLVDQSTHITSVSYEWSNPEDKDTVLPSRLSEGDTLQSEEI